MLHRSGLFNADDVLEPVGGFEVGIAGHEDEGHAAIRQRLCDVEGRPWPRLTSTTAKVGDIVCSIRMASCSLAAGPNTTRPRDQRALRVHRNEIIVLDDEDGAAVQASGVVMTMFPKNSLS